MQTGYRNLRRWPFATILSARKYGCDNIFAKRGAELGSKLCMAILRGDNLETDRLLAAGAPLDFRDEPDGWTPLIYSIYYRNQRACEWLLDHGADPKQCDFSGAHAADGGRHRRRHPADQTASGRGRRPGSAGLPRSDRRGFRPQISQRRVRRAAAGRHQPQRNDL